MMEIKGRLIKGLVRQRCPVTLIRFVLSLFLSTRGMLCVQSLVIGVVIVVVFLMTLHVSDLQWVLILLVPSYLTFVRVVVLCILWIMMI